LQELNEKLNLEEEADEEYYPQEKIYFVNEPIQILGNQPKEDTT